MIFRALLMTGSSSVELGDWNLARSVVTTETGDLGHNAVVSSVTDISEANVTISASSGDRPTLDTTTQLGARLCMFDSDDRLSGAVTDTVRTVVMLIRVPSSPNARVLVARDTSATTTKPAFSIGFSA